EMKGTIDKAVAAPVTQPAAPPAPPAAPPGPAPASANASAAAAAAEEVADKIVTPEILTVGASSRGYEGMLKDLINKLPDNPPADMKPGSDLAKLFEAKANPGTINTEIHKLAMSHKFFTDGVDGGSIRIDPSAQITIVDGQIKFTDAAHTEGMVNAEEGMKVTPTSQPESPTRPEVSMRADPTSPYDMTRIDADQTDDVLTVEESPAPATETPSASVEKVDSQSLIARLESAQSPTEARSTLDTLFNNGGISREAVEAAIKAAPQMSVDPELTKIIDPNTGVIPGPAVFLGQDGGLTVYGATQTGDMYTAQRTLAERFATLYGQPVKVLLPGGEPGYELVSPGGKVTIEKPPFFSFLSSYKAPLSIAQSVYAFPR
ncbi:MAG: hypothetical protein Q7N50_08590, partial [Armatimonadota bacterium]|nr:hypothetical protein [Armatimonadota bacterium]